MLMYTVVEQKNNNLSVGVGLLDQVVTVLNI
jgi:hypothetical protein